MTDGLSLARILDAAEDLLRRWGPEKTGVTDVARALGVSHSAVYRHVPSKAALMEAVAARWLESVTAPLRVIAAADGAPALPRLKAWLQGLAEAKAGHAASDPGLFRTYAGLVEATEGAVERHLADMAGQLARILADGQSRGEIRSGDPLALAASLLEATALFHHPVHAAGWSAPDRAARFERLWSLLHAGLSALPPAVSPASPSGRT